MPETKVRRTAAQKRQEAVQEAEARRAADETAARAGWLGRLMNNLEVAQSFGFSLNVRAGAFHLCRAGLVYRLAPVPEGRFNYEWDSTGDWDAMVQLERQLRDLELERDEALREEAVRQRAKSKLTDEEMRALGLKR